MHVCFVKRIKKEEEEMIEKVFMLLGLLTKIKYFIICYVYFFYFKNIIQSFKQLPIFLNIYTSQTDKRKQRNK